MFIIRKQFDFSASHRLEGLPKGHQCGRDHGHNYIVVVTMSSPTLDEVGFVKDYGELNVIKKWLDDIVEHRNLNTVVTFNPTAENLAKWFFDMFEVLFSWHGLISSVEVRETPKTSATYTRGVVLEQITISPAAGMTDEELEAAVAGMTDEELEAAVERILKQREVVV